MNGAERRARLGLASLYLCTPVRDDLAGFVASVCAAGVDVVQLREKDAGDREVLAAAGVARDAAHAYGALFVLNDRPDLALTCRADGVHVGRDDPSPSSCRRILGRDVLVGFSTHAPAELDAALTEPVDYVSVGPVEPTPTKPGRPGTGLGYVEYAAERCSLPFSVPFFVTGGVSPTTLPPLAAAGARRFVVVRALTESPDPAATARELRRMIDTYRS